MASRALLASAVLLALFAPSASAGGDAAAGKDKAKVCAACHGTDGNSPAGQTPQPPRLAGQHADYLVKTLEDYASKARNNVLMSALVANLSAQDREDIAAYFASRSTVLDIIQHTR